MTGASTPMADSNLAFARRSETLLSVALLAVLVVLLVPLPTILLDMLIALNLGITILLLLITLSAKQPLDISVFPSVLLLMTLYRLSLNVATTRLILLNGDAGRIVSTFGGFVVGGSLVVGLVIFLILILIQFVVITKGASRISEVNARFTLDAMPGKQMAIDAELSAGTIDENEAHSRRQKLAREAEFYGAMDGAGKFVRGDAIAGLLITGINLIGGVILGLSHGLTIGEAFSQYSVLTIGDGLVSQIPALIIATTAGILVTKAASEASLGHEIGTQLLANQRPLWIGSGIMVAVALTPGLPKLPFILLAGLLVLFLRYYGGKVPKPETGEEEAKQHPNQTQDEDHLNDFIQTDRLSLEIGTQLIPLVETRRTKGLKDRIASLRRDVTRKHGMWVPTIRIRSSIRMDAHVYRILVAGREVARGELRPDQFLAIDPGRTTLELEGEETTDPAFGLSAMWIRSGDRRRAELGGYTVVDAPSVLITHLGEILRRYSHELLSREDLQKMLDKVKENAPTVVDELKPDLVRMGVLHQVLVYLLKEGVPIANLTLILESVVHHAAQTKEPGELTELVRRDIGRIICDGFRDDNGRVRVIVLDPRLEMALRESGRDGNLALQPKELEKLIGVLSREWQKAGVQNQPAALLTDGQLRRMTRRAIERALPDLAVVAYTEIPGDLLIEPVAMLQVEEVFEASAGPRPDTAAEELGMGATNAAEHQPSAA